MKLKNTVMELSPMFSCLFYVFSGFCSLFPPSKTPVVVLDTLLPIGVNECMNVCVHGLASSLYSCLMPSVPSFTLNRIKHLLITRAMNDLNRRKREKINKANFFSNFLNLPSD